MDDSRWDLNQKLETEADGDLVDTIEEPASPSPEVPPTDPVIETPGNQADYYADLIRASIADGGKFGDHRISMHWLRMTLLGLEGKHLEVDEMWAKQSLEMPSQVDETTFQGRPSYDEIFRNSCRGASEPVME